LAGLPAQKGSSLHVLGDIHGESERQADEQQEAAE
jgi:hypothetical protein